MNRIYDLTYGDVYYTKGISFHCSDQTVKITPHWCKIQEEDEDDKFNTSRQSYEARLLHGNVFLTKEECQKSIDYDVALAKIKQRASELEYRYSDEGERKIYTIWNEEEALYVAPHSKTNAFKLTFKASETAIIIKEELPEECKTVLDNNCIYVGEEEK